MPIEIKTTAGSKQPGRTFQSGINVSDMVLPTEKSAPSMNLADYFIFLYGQRKIGKTSFTSNFPNALHIFLEPGGKGLSTYQMEVAYWEQFQKIIELLKGPSGARFENIVVDTADLAYDIYQNWYCRKEYIEHPSEPNDYGRTWDLLKAGFADAIHELTHLGKGVIFISHAKEVEIKTLHRGTMTKIVPTLRDRAAGYVMGVADMNLYYTYFGRERFLLIDGNEINEDLGGRAMKHNFRTTSGERVVAIPMGRSDEEAYANFVKAFQNQQEDSYASILDEQEGFDDHTVLLKKKMGKKD